MRNLKILWKVLPFVLFLQLGLVNRGLAFRLEEDGSYTLVVAVDENAAQNSLTGYVENIKEGVKRLSNFLHEATNSKFSIKNVDIIVPSHWYTETNDGVASTIYYNAADIKISHLQTLPTVDNPNPCGRPGSSILLPYHYFDVLQGPYEDVGKALLPLFARWRFGVWEEHGYPGDRLFPYFWKPLEQETWDVNVCRNAPLKGEFTSVDEEEDDDDCTPNDDELPPSTNCRFIPDLLEQTANASMMGFHYLPSITHFCTKENHNAKLPSRQNYFCRYQSVWEVIQNSEDWQRVTRPNVPSPITYRIVKNSALPLLYILLDSGISQAPSAVLQNISEALQGFVMDAELSDVLVSVGTYPPENDDSFLTEVIPWTPLVDRLDDILVVLNSTFGRKPGFRDFGGALNEAIQIANIRKHAKGGAVLMVKTGVETNRSRVTPESTVVVNTLLSNVRIFAIEVKGNEVNPGVALENVVTKSAGAYFPLGPSPDLKEELEGFIATVKSSLMDTEIKREYVLAMREIVPANAPVLLKVGAGIVQFEAYLIPWKGYISPTPAPSWAYADNIGNTPNANFAPSREWGSPATSQPMTFYASPVPFAEKTHSNWGQFRYSCAFESKDCEVVVFAIVKLANQLASLPQVSLSVSSSSLGQKVDLEKENAATDLGAPLAIYAKLTEDGFPLAQVPQLWVCAYISSLEDPREVYKVALNDDGLAVPDVIQNDGVYSATFIPVSSGTFHVFVTVRFVTPLSITMDDEATQSYQNGGMLLPVDQINVGCGTDYRGCWVQEPETSFAISEELPYPIEFVNVDRYIPLVHRITDLVASPTGNYSFEMIWSEPGVYTSRGLVKADSYQIKYSSNFESLLNDFENQEDVFPLDERPEPSHPGNIAHVHKYFGEEARIYVAIKATTRLTPDNFTTPVLSVIVPVRVIMADPIIVTTTSLPVTKPTFGSTTAVTWTTTSTPITGSTTTEEMSTSSTTTVLPNRTSIAPLTTTTTTPVTTSRLPTRTSPALTTTSPPKHWFNQKEGQITIIVFGIAMLSVILGGFYIIVKLKNR